MRLPTWLRRQARTQNLDPRALELRRLRKLRRRLAIESLEDRVAPSVSATVDAANKLTITTSGNGPDTILVTVSGTDVKVNGADPTRSGGGATAAGSLTAIQVTGGTGVDTVDLSAVTAANGFNLAGSPGTYLVTIDGAGGDNTLTGSGFADSITGGAGNDRVTGLAGADALIGGAGDDVYVFGDAFGADTFTESIGGGTDTLDFTDHAAKLTVNAARTTFTSADGSTLTAAGQPAERVDVNFVSGAKAAVDDVLDKLAGLADKLQTGATALSQLSHQLPLLDQAGQTTAAQLLGFAQKISDFRDKAELAINGLAGAADLSTIVADLNGLTLPPGFGTITFTSDYRGAPADSASPDGQLEGLIKVHLAASASHAIPIDLGKAAQDVGLNVSGTLTVDSTLAADFTAGLTTDAVPAAFLVPSADPTEGLNVGVHAHVTGLNAALKLGFLTAGINNGSVDFAGTVHVALVDPDGGTEITTSELTSTPASLVSASVQTPSFAASLPVSVGVGVKVGGVDLNSLSATLALGLPNPADLFTGGVPKFSLWAGSHPAAGLTLSATTGTAVAVTADADAFAATDVGHVILFDGGSATITAVADATHATVKVLTDFPSTSVASGTWLLGSTNLLDFSNVTPNEVMDMLTGVLNNLSALAGSAALKTPVPFTGKTVGDLLDYATAFKAKVIDPLFVSGNSLRPDNDGDGTPDFNFDSIQSLVDQLTTALSLPPITAAYVPDTKELSFSIDFSRALGFGHADVTEAQVGDASHDEVQTLTVNAIDTAGTLPDTFRLAFPDANGLLQFTAPLARTASAADVQAALRGLSGIGSGNVNVTVPDAGAPNVYRIEFVNALAHKAEPRVQSDATNLAGAFPLDFGTALGDFASLKTTGQFSMAASLTAGLTFGIDLNPSQKLEVTPPVAAPKVDVTVRRPDGATTNAVQKVTVHGANGGAFTLTYPGTNSTTGAIPFNASQGAVQAALSLIGITSSVTVATAGVDRVYTITFTNPANPTALLVPNPAGLVGTADNGLLASASGSADAHFSTELFNQPITVSDGVTGHAPQTIARQSLGSVSVTVPRTLQAATLTLGATSGTGVSATTNVDTFSADDVGQQVLAGAGLAVITAVTDAKTATVNIINSFASTSVAASTWALGRPLSALAGDVQSAINTQLVGNGLTAGLTLGFLSGGKLSTGAITTGGSGVTATGIPFAHVRNDIGFTLKLTGSKTQDVTGTLRAVDVLDPAADPSARTLFNPDGTLDLTKLNATVSASTLAARLQAALTSALNLAGVTGFTVTVGTSAGKLTFNVTAVPQAGDKVELVFDQPIVVDAGGGRLSLSTPPVQFSAQNLAPAVTADRLVQTTADYNDTAFQELGLLSSPTRFDGKTDDPMAFTLVVNGASVPVTLAAQPASGLTALRDALQTAVDTALGGAGFNAGDVEVFLVDPAGNRIGFRGKDGVVDTIALNVPEDGDPGTLGTIEPNGAVTELGFDLGDGPTQRAKATEFFLDNVDLTGHLSLIASGVSATASLGFLSVQATGAGTLGGNKFVDATADFALKNPVTGGTRLTPDVLAGAFQHGQFLFDAAHVGGTDDDPATGIVAGTISGGIGVNLDIAPAGVLAGLPSLDAHAELSATSPNWLVAPPGLSDPLGFGTDARALGSGPVVLDTAVPSSGRLTQDVSFVLSDGTHEAVGFLRAKATAGFTGTADLVTALQAAVDDARARLAAASGSAVGAITVALSNGKVQLTSGSPGLSVRGNLVKVDFQGPDFDNLLSKLRHLSFSDIASALQLLTGFLHSLDGTGGAGGAIAGALGTKLPLINRSIGDLLDTASALGQKLDAIEANPAGSLQELEGIIRNALGVPAAFPPILSLDMSHKDADNNPDPIVDIDFTFGAGADLSRPFALNLADAGLPSFLTDLIGVGASGNLAVSAHSTFHLALGLDLTGDDKGFFLRTGADGTSLDAQATASGSNLDFNAKLGPFGLFVVNGTASLDGHVNLHLLDPHGTGRLVLAGWDGSGVTSDLGNLGSFVGSNSITVSGTAHAGLPLFIGTDDFKEPLDFLSANPGTDNALTVDVNLVNLFTGAPGGFSFHTPNFNFNSIPTPGIFALLSDPSVVVDGLDHLLGTLQDALSGQLFGAKLPFIGNVLQDNPAAHVLGDIRDHLLKPLANTLRENNVNLDGLVTIIETSIFNVLKPLGLIQHHDADGNVIPDGNDDATIDDIQFRFFDADGHETDNPLIAHAAQFDIDLGKEVEVPLSHDIAFDLGFPALGIAASFRPTIKVGFHVHLGFGVDQSQGFYFVSNHTVPEMTADVNVYLSPPEGAAATLQGRLLFLALNLTDGVEGTGRSTVHLGGDVILDDPNHDGRLTFAEMVSGSLSDIFKPELTGSADLRAHGVVDFSTIDPGLAKVLPSISADLMVHMGLSIAPGTGFQFDPPSVGLANISLDLGNFISSFAAPILGKVKETLDPLAWLIGPDGFLNKRIPLLSDLAGHTITGKDLVTLFDPTDGPKVVAFLNFVQELYFLANLVDSAGNAGGVKLNFGDLVLTGKDYFTAQFPAIFDHVIDVGGFNGVTDISKAKNLNNFKLPDNLPEPSFSSPPPSSTSTFTSGVQKPGSIDFAILKPATIFKLLMGQPDVTLVTVTLPEFGFNFFYRQSFPIFGPLVATFGGGIGATIDLTFGYDTRGIQEFLSDKNPADLLDGFFIQAIDPATGARTPQITFDAQIAVGAALDLGIAKAGVEGGIEAIIKFFLDDLNQDGKVRLQEIGANLVANSFNPIAVFDISGEIDFFMRAFLEINLGFFTLHKDFEFVRLKLVDFNIEFIRPAILGSVTDGVLTVNVGPSAGNRLHGDTSDDSETVYVGSSGSDVKVSGFGTGTGDLHFKDINLFSGVTKVVINGGAGDDFIDVSDLSAAGIPVEVHGGDGNDTIIGGAGDDSLYGEGGADVVIGNGGADLVDGGADNDFLFGDGMPGSLPAGFTAPTFTTSGSAGADSVTGGDGNDYVYGGDAADVLAGGAGNDTFARSAGGDEFALADFGSVDHIVGSGVAGDTLDFTGKTQNLTYFLADGSIGVGFNQIPGTPGASIADFTSQLIVDDPTDISTILGGDGVDTFHVYGTKAAGILLNGQKGSDQYVFHLDGTDATINATVTDTGNPWDSGDTIRVDGSSGADVVRVTGANLTLDAGQATPHEVVTYTSPAADANVLQIKVNGNAGDDRVTVAGTSQTVPVRVDGGAGNDVVTVGEGTVTGITGRDRPGLNAPIGIGPLVLVGGAGHDAFVLDDSTDTAARTGNLTAFRETRTGVIDPVEVGVLSGLGTTLVSESGTTDGRVEFEGFEAADVKLGTKADSFTIGGGFNLDKTAADGGQADAALGVNTAFPKNRLADNPGDPNSVGINGISNSITGMTIVEGGGDNDTIGVIATNTLDRNTLLTAAPGPLAVGATVTPGDGGTNEVQTVTISGAAHGVGYFTLGYRFAETAPIPFGATADQVRDALVALSVVGTNASHQPNVAVAKSLVDGNDVYTVTFQNGLGHRDVTDLHPLITPLVVVGDATGIATAVKTVTQGKQSGPATNEVQAVAVSGVPGTTFALTFQQGTTSETTAPIDYGAGAADVVAKLEALAAIGAGDVAVTKGTVDGADVYTITFQNGQGHKDVAQLLARIVQDGNDTLNVQALRETAFFLGGGGADTVHLNVDTTTGNPLATNGVNARITLDGQGGGDTYDIHLIGGTTASLVNVFDSGFGNDGTDVLTVTGTELPDLFLARASSSQQGLAFVGLLNHDGAKAVVDQPVERVNYDINLEAITVNSLGGDDKFYLDDTRATITINAGSGNDFFQIGQLFQTTRVTDPSTGIVDGDAFATIETTKGWLSNGVSFPVTINGDAGEDEFIVFHNLAVATLNGGADDDTFIIQAFALAGSTEDHRALTDLSGDAGADFIQYAVDAPVNINGGDGFDTVIVIGTEFGDDFVVTPKGVFGAGLNVNFVNVELLQVDGAEGDDRFFVLGTGPDFVTEISGGLGTDLFSINGPTPANGVISNDLLGHSGILTHDVSSGDVGYDGKKAVGVSANVADNDEGAVIVTQTDGGSQVVQGTLPASGTVAQRYAAGLASHVLDSYTIVLSRPPINGTEVTVSVTPPPGLVLVGDDGAALVERRKPDGTADGLPLTFTGADWYQPRTVYFKADDTLVDIPDIGDIQHKVTAAAPGDKPPEIKSTATGGGNGTAVTTTTLTPGGPAQNEVQRATVSGAGFGFFVLKYRDAETDPIPFGASAADVQTALVALPLIGKNANGQPNVAVTGAAGGPYTITFQNDLAHQDVPQVTGREEATLVDSSLPAALAPGAGENLPEGLRGAFVTITDCESHPEVAGQTRLILFQSADGQTLVVNKPWALPVGMTTLPSDAAYEIKMFSGLSIPNVRARIYTAQTPALVVVQTDGSTSVAEASGTGSALDAQLTKLQADEIDVRLSAPPTGPTTVALDGHGQLEFFDGDNPAHPQITQLTFDGTTYSTFRHVLVRGIDDGLVEGFHKSDLTLTATGGGYTGTNSLIVADIADNDAPGVRVIESGGSTDVIEFTDGRFGVSAATADAAGLPRNDQYQVVLTAAPSQPVTVTVTSNPTRTSRTGGIRSFVEQLEVSTDGGATWGLTGTVTFSNNPADANAWDKPHTVLVRAIDDPRVDGADTQVFAPTLDQVTSVQGPLFVNGGSGPDRTGLTELLPVMLPYEIDEKAPVGDVRAATESVGPTPATITIDPTQIDQAEVDAFNAQPNATAHLTFPLTDPTELKNASVQITHGPGKNKVRVVTAVTANPDGTWTLTLSHSWFSPFPAPGNPDVPDATSKYVLLQTNPNLLVSESDQTDVLQVHDTDNVNSFNDPALPPGQVNPTAVGQLAFDATPFGAKATVGTAVNGGPKTSGPAVNEVQRLTLAATAGTFTLQFQGQTTAPIPFNPTAAQVQGALEALGAIGAGNVSVTKAPGDPVYTVTFQGALGLTDQPQMHADAANLTGGTPLNQFRLTGLGMGGGGPSFTRSIGTGLDARPEPGGITLQQFEDLEIDLGSGNDHFTVVNTPAGTKTTIDAGAGNDLVDVKSIADHTFVNLGAGSDTINVRDDAHTLAGLTGLLTVSGDAPRATVVPLAKGSPAQGSLIAPVNAIQRITIDATGGTFTLSLTDPATQATATTGNLAWNISAADLRTALGGLSTVGGANNVQVTKAGNVYKVTFVNGMGARDVPLLASNEAGLTNGLGATDVMNVDDGGNSRPSVGVLTSSSLTGLDTNQVNEIQTLVVDATQGTFRVSFAGAQSGPLAYNVSAAGLRAALESLPGAPIKPGDVAVTRNDDVYVIRFQGNLTNADVPQVVATNIDLQKRVEPAAGDPGAAASAATATAGDPTLVGGSVTVTTRVQGTADPKVNDAQVLTVDATGGTFTLSLLSGTPEEFTTRPLPFDASAEVVRQAIQDAAAAAVAPGDTFEPQKFAVTVDKYANVYVIAFQGRLRQLDGGPGVDLLKVNTAGLTGTASVTTRMDGINYYGLERLNIDTGTNADVFNVQGTTPGSRGFALGGTLNGTTYAPGVAVTNVRMHNGNEQAFVASNADLDFDSAPGFDFLTGTLDDVRGALNLDFGTGTHGLMVSDEGSTVGDPNVRIVDDLSASAAAAAGLDPAAEISITGLAPAGISYKADATGNFFTGIRYWTGSGNDNITIDGTANRSGSGQRTMTLLNTGLGNDTVTAALTGALNQPTGDTGPDGFFALNTMGGSFSPIPTGLPAGVTDNDTVDASASTLPLVVFGGLGSDNITAGSNTDIVFGDDGRVQYADPASPNTVLAAVGFGGRGDVISSRVLQPTWAMSRDLTLGAGDTVRGLAGEDVLVGGAAGDAVDGGADDDLVFGDAAKIARRPADVTNPRFEALTGGQLYSTAPATAGADQVDGVAHNYRDPNGTYVPSIANWRVHNLYHSAAVQAGTAGSLGTAEVAGGTNVTNSFGGDYLAGGAASDVIFGQLGNDTIQGDGSITTGAGASRDANNALVLSPSVEAATDGDDYIEGGGGNDTAFGGLGQDDVIGGSSDLFTLDTAAKRPDGADLLFGGAGTDVSRNNVGDATVDANGVITTVPTGHARDADVLAGDNADVFRVVGTNRTDLGGFQAFNYDQSSAFENRGTLRVIPRAVRLLDYTPGGPDFNPAAAADLGGNDEIHGESGDDIAYGQKGNDVLFGDGQDDDLIGNSGNDWISGGTGRDGILGDDGRIYTSRNTAGNPAQFSEPLNGVPFLLASDPSARTTNGNVLNEAISTPGNIQQAVINVGGALQKRVDETPFSVDPNWNATTDEFGGSPAAHNSDDMIYGGLGSDWLHGGSGDDAISGAEALPESYIQTYSGTTLTGIARSDFGHPLNPGDMLRFNPLDPNGPHFDRTRRAGEFALYDEYDPLRVIQLNPDGTLNKDGTGKPFALNFNPGEGEVRPAGVTGGNQSVPYPAANDDGADAIFGDLGNDWLVGGTGRDDMYGGFGNDLLNADDDPTTAGGLNTSPDTQPSFEDRAFGGAGRDVLVGNTGGDRLIDWAGEFNSYLVPFAPFGMGTVSRALQPQLPEFLYALSAADGADFTRAADTGADPARNGEPWGELGLIRQQDFAWQAQTGAPSDPQAGNIPGGPRDVLRSANFNDGQTQGFAADSGNWEVQGAALDVAATSPAGDAAAVFEIGDQLPTYFELQASVTSIKPTGGWNANAYLIFDYNTATDFKFAGIDMSLNKLVMGHRTAADWVVDRQIPFQGKPDTYYNMLLSANGNTATLVVNNAASLSYAFPPRVVDGYTYGLNWGLVGMGSNNARGKFDNVAVQVLPPQITLDETETFDDGAANRFTGAKVGTWQVPVAGGNGRYVGIPPAGGDRALSLVDLGIGRGLAANSYLELSARLSTQAAGGFAYDAYGTDDFKFVYVDAKAGQVVFGHRTPLRGWVVDKTVARAIPVGTDFDLGLSVKGSTVSVTVNGQSVGGYVYNAVAVDGAFGALTRGGSSSFDSFRIKTNDPAFASGGSPLRVATAPPAGAPAPAPLTAARLRPIYREAVRRWLAAGADSAALRQVRIEIADLPDGMLGDTTGRTIRIDPTAAGWGWFVDRTPRTDAEFRLPGDQGEQGHMDLLTAVMHEIGHALGRDHEPTGLMVEDLQPGERENPLPEPGHHSAGPAAKAPRGAWFLSRSSRR